MATRGTNIILDCFVRVTADNGSLWKHSYNKTKYKQNTIRPMTVTKVWDGTVSLTSGEASLDLTSLSGGVDMTGLGVKYAQIKAHADNTESVAIDGTRGNSSVPTPNRCHSWRAITVYPGDSVMQPMTDGLDFIVSSTSKIILLLSDDADAVVYVRIAAGPY